MAAVRLCKCASGLQNAACNLLDYHPSICHTIAGFAVGCWLVGLSWNSALFGLCIAAMLYITAVQRLRLLFLRELILAVTNLAVIFHIGPSQNSCCLLNIPRHVIQIVNFGFAGRRSGSAGCWHMEYNRQTDVRRAAVEHNVFFDCIRARRRGRLGPQCSHCGLHRRVQRTKMSFIIGKSPPCSGCSL